MEVLRTDGLKKYYGAGEKQVHALDGVDLSVKQGEFLAIVGTSGSGKSTLLHMLGGLDRPTKGKVFVDGKDIFSLNDEALTIFRRRKIGFVFQAFNLVPVLNVYENIVLPIELDGNIVDEKYVGSVIDVLGLSGKTDSMPSQLSGGQQQRVAIARAIAAEPPVILADEPTGNLDSASTEEIMGILKGLHEAGRSVILITHDNEIAEQAKRVVRILDGKIVEDYYNAEKKAQEV